MHHIAYLLADFPVLSETFVGNEIRAMRAHGHQVTPIIMRRAEGMAQPEDMLMAREALDLATLPRGMASLFFPDFDGGARAAAFALRQKALSSASLLYQGARIGSALRAMGATHLHAHFAGGAAAHGIVAARLAGISVSFVCHGHDVYSEPEDLPAKLHAADLVIAVCDELRDDLKAMAPRARLAVVPCGIDPDRFRYAGGRAHHDRLLFVGRLVEQKGIDDLIAALALMPPEARPRLDLVGSGSQHTALVQLAARLGLGPDALTFLGPKPATWFAENGAGYLGLVAPFKCAPDGARDTGPLVVKEAMALGLPVVSTAFMGVKEMLTPATGWMVSPGAPEALGAAILALKAQSPAARRQMVENARARVVERFTLARSAALLSDAFEALR